MEGITPEDAADGRGGPDREDFGVLRESPTLGDGKYKLEIGMKQAGCFVFVFADLRGGRYASADTDRRRGDKYPYSFPLRDMSHVGRPECRVRNLSIHVSCDQVPGGSRRGTRCEGRLGMGYLANRVDVQAGQRSLA